jgi:hypothetical protein
MTCQHALQGLTKVFEQMEPIRRLRGCWNCFSGGGGIVSDPGRDSPTQFPGVRPSRRLTCLPSELAAHRVPDEFADPPRWSRTCAHAVPEKSSMPRCVTCPTGSVGSATEGTRRTGLRRKQRHTPSSCLMRACGYFNARRQGKQGNDGHLGRETLHEKKW